MAYQNMNVNADELNHRHELELSGNTVYSIYSKSNPMTKEVDAITNLKFQ